MHSAEHFSEALDAQQRDSHTRVIDLSDPLRKETEVILNEQKKSDEIITLAKIVEARTKIISASFEKGTKTQDAVRTAELIEETRYWLEDLNQQLDFIHDHRKESGNEHEFSEAASAIISAKKSITSELDHMLEIVRIWHEDDPQEEAFSEILASEQTNEEHLEDEYADVNDSDLIQEDAPVAETMITAENEQAQASDSVTDASYLPNGYHVESANDNADYESITPEEEQIISKQERTRETPKNEAELIDIPASLIETRAKYSALNRTVRDIEAAINRNPRYADRHQFDQYLLDLSRQYSAFEERLTILQHHSEHATEDAMEEKEVLHDALALIEDTRHKIHKIDFTPKTEQEQQVERLLDLKFAKKQTLESIADRLTSAIERSGIANPELYMVEQSSGLGSIRRSIMGLFGKKETLINKATLTKLKNEAIQAEERYLEAAYHGVNDKAIPFYEKAVEKSRILKLKDSNDIHELWQAIHHEMEELGEQVETPEALQLHEGEGETKVSNALYDIEVAPVKEAARNQRSEGIAYRKKELSTIKDSELQNTAELLSLIKNDPAASELTFLPADYIGALAELKIANKSKDTQKIAELLPRAQSMKDEMLDLWIDTTNEEGKPIYDDIDVLEKAKHLLEEGKKKPKTVKRKK